MNRHTGEKPYKYDRYGKAFGPKTNLTSHTRAHISHSSAISKNLIVVTCLIEIDLKRHKYSIHGISTEKHICPICSNVYPEKTPEITFNRSNIMNSFSLFGINSKTGAMLC